MSVEDHTVSFSLEVNVEEAYANVRRLETLLYRTISLLRRMGLPEEVDEAIMKIQRIITTLNQWRLALAAVSAAQMGAGPLGWALAGVGIAAAIAAQGDLMYELRSH